MIAAWSVDRLGRSLQDLVGLLNELQSLKCDLYLHQQALDTSTLSGRAMFQMCGVFAEFENPDRAALQDVVDIFGVQELENLSSRHLTPSVPTPATLPDGCGSSPSPNAARVRVGRADSRRLETRPSSPNSQAFRNRSGPISPPAPANGIGQTRKDWSLNQRRGDCSSCDMPSSQARGSQ
jgi:hypothetical protein